MDEIKREQIMQNRAQRSERANKQKEKKDYFTSVTLVQTVLCTALAVIVIIISKAGGTAADKLKTDFTNLMNWSLENTDSESVIESVKQFFANSESLLPAFSPVTPPEDTSESEMQSDESETADANDSEPDQTESTEESEKFKEENITQSAETTQIGEAETIQLNTKDAGGEDIKLYKAADNASFSPVSTTCAIVRPVDSTNYTSYFGYRINPITNEKSFHTGLDIAAPLGTKIRAAYAGTVRKVGEDDHSGKYIFISHEDGFETFYCHCSEILADEGAVLRQGESIALVGSTGWSTGPHLHFEIRKGGQRLNPLWVLQSDND